MKRLYIVDDHKMMQKGVKDYLEENTDWRVPKTFSQSRECLKALKDAGGRNELPQIVIVDVQLLNESGIALASQIARDFPSVKCVMYSMYDTAGYIMQAASAGVKGYISKVASEGELVRCLETVLSGKEYFEGKARGSLEKIEKVSPLLTRQEKRILEKLLQQKSNEEIAGELFISLHTVENYVSYIYDKLCVKSRAELEAAFD